MGVDGFDLVSNNTPQPTVPEVSSPNSQAILPLDEIEKQAILEALDITEGNKSETARKLGITRRTLHQKLKKYGVMK